MLNYYFNIFSTFLHNYISRKMRRLELNITILGNAAIHIFNIIILVYVIYIRILDFLLIIQRYRYPHCSTRLNLFAVHQEFDIVGMDLLDGFLFFDRFFCDLVFGFLAELYRCYGKLCVVRKVCRIGKSNLDIDLVTLVIISGDLRLNFFFLHILRLFCLITAVNNLCHITSYVSLGSFPGNLVPGCSVLCCYGIQKCELCSCVYSCQNLCLDRWADTKIRIVSQNLDQACLTILICCRNILRARNILCRFFHHIRILCRRFGRFSIRILRRLLRRLCIRSYLRILCCRCLSCILLRLVRNIHSVRKLL